MSNLNVKVNSYLRRLASGRVSRVVTADDIHTYASRNNFKLSTRKAQSLASGVFSNSNYMPVGETASNRPKARYRKITEWMVV